MKKIMSKCLTLAVVFAIVTAMTLSMAGEPMDNLKDKVLARLLERTDLPDSTINKVLRMPDITGLDISGNRIVSGQYLWVAEDYSRAAIVSFKPYNKYDVKILFDYTGKMKR